MSTELIKPDDIARAAELLKAGELVAFPTDTFFALGAVLTNESIGRLFAAKRRAAGNPVPVLVSSSEQVSQVCERPLNEAEAALAERFWPGALTLVVPVSDNVPDGVSAGTEQVGVRVPDHDLARQLIELVGSPVTGTSANRSGNEPAKTAAAVIDQLDQSVVAIVDAACGPHIDPSTVVTLADGEPKILRAGAISEVEIRDVLSGSAES